MTKTTVSFDGKLYNLKRSFRSLMEFETLTGKQASEVSNSVSDTIKLFYCMLKASNKDVFDYSLDAFIDAIDASPEMLSVFLEYLTDAARAETSAKKKAVTH